MGVVDGGRCGTWVWYIGVVLKYLLSSLSFTLLSMTRATTCKHRYYIRMDKKQEVPMLLAPDADVSMVPPI